MVIAAFEAAALSSANFIVARPGVIDGERTVQPNLKPLPNTGHFVLSRLRWRLPPRLTADKEAGGIVHCHALSLCGCCDCPGGVVDRPRRVSWPARAPGRCCRLHRDLQLRRKRCYQGCSRAGRRSACRVECGESRFEPCSPLCRPLHELGAVDRVVVRGA